MVIYFSVYGIKGTPYKAPIMVVVLTTVLTNIFKIAPKMTTKDNVSGRMKRFVILKTSARINHRRCIVQFDKLQGMTNRQW